MSVYDHWLGFARWTPLVLLTDLDGTLLPFAETPDIARPGPELIALLGDLAASPGVTAAVVSGRPRAALETFFDECRGLFLVAEHGGWRRGAGPWEPVGESEEADVDSLAAALRSVAARFRGALVERKTWSVAFHARAVRGAERGSALVEAEHQIDGWLLRHPQFHELRGAEVLEVRPTRMNKSSAVNWLRQQAGDGCRLLALGDDTTDEDMFASLGPVDESVIVGTASGRLSSARWRLSSVEDAGRFLQWLLAVRRGTADEASAISPERVERASGQLADEKERFRLLVVSNRLPELRSAAESTEHKRNNVGGLVSALEPALRERRSVWLGWSGRTLAQADATRFGLDDSQPVKFAWVDLPEAWRRGYYSGFCNSTLWPLLHSFPDRVRLKDEDWQAYRDANQAFAAAAGKLVGPHDTVWVHDYHLLLLGQCLRQRGHAGPIGIFMHVPFPGPDLFAILPWAEELLVAMLELDLIGFHTPAFVANFLHCAATIPGTRIGDGMVEYRDRRTRVGAFPIGIIPEEFSAERTSGYEDALHLMRAIAPSRLVLGVDRLDYTKGIPERLSAFARLLELHPEWRRQVSLVQISVPSRSDVTDYAEQRERIEQIVGRTNGEFGDADWVPIRYLYRSFDRDQLSHLYRNAAVGYVTPLRDGMNLVAKEYVAAQDPNDPGVLLLSRFAGAAAELSDAVLTNPWHVDGLARDLDLALRMEKPERQARHVRLSAAVARTTALSWAEDFLSALTRRE